MFWNCALPGTLAPRQPYITSSFALVLFLGLQDAPWPTNENGAVWDRGEPNPSLCQSPSIRSTMRPHPCPAVVFPPHSWGCSPDPRSLTCVDSKWLGCFFKHKKVLIFFYENKKKVILYPWNHQRLKTHGMSNSCHGLVNPKVATVQERAWRRAADHS